jgi:hypothetical protein
MELRATGGKFKACGVRGTKNGADQDTVSTEWLRRMEYEGKMVGHGQRAIATIRGWHMRSIGTVVAPHLPHGLFVIVTALTQVFGKL